MRPLTDTVPKPMIPVNGKPFLEYLIELLKRNGIEEVVLLLGYLPEKITEHFGDGSRFGLSIKYSVTPVEDDTGTRVVKAKDLLRDNFLLMYCDNYWSQPLDKLYKFHNRRGLPVTTLVYANSKRPVTKSNVLVDAEGFVTLYDKSRTVPDLNGVELGFFVADKSVLNYAPDFNFNFEKEVLPKLVAERKLAGYLTDQRYYSIGSIDRLLLTTEFLSGKKVVLLDRDGVINEKAPKADYVKNWGEFKFLPGAVRAIKLFNDKGYKVFVITNQPGIARGMMTRENLEDIHEKMKEELKKNGAQINGIYQCLHGWNDGCDCRKPKPGLLYEAAFQNNFDLTKAVIIGDDERDVQAGEAAGCRTILLKPGQSFLEVAKNLLRK